MLIWQHNTPSLMQPPKHFLDTAQNAAGQVYSIAEANNIGVLKLGSDPNTSYKSARRYYHIHGHRTGDIVSQL